MPEPAASTVAASAQLAGAAALAGALTGLDYITLVGGFVGALHAMSRQETIGGARRVIAVLSTTLLALFVVWAVVETLPAIWHELRLGSPPDIRMGRGLIAWVVGYFAQDTILPAMGRALTAATARLGLGRTGGEQ